MIYLSKKTSNRNCWETFPWASSMRHLDYYLKPLISVVLPVYNQASLVKDSLNSIFFKNNYPLEVIIVDDGSTDNLEKVIKPYLKDPTKNIKYIYQKNQKLSRALNTGFTYAQGVFLGWTSADNIYLPGALEKMADFLLANPSVSLVYANVELIDDSGKKIKNSNYRKDNQAKTETSTLLLPNNASTLCDYNDNFLNACFLYRRETRLAVGDFDPEKNGFEDYDYWCRVNTQGIIAHIDCPKPLYQYRLHENSMTHQLRETNLSQQQSEAVFTAHKKIKLLKSKLTLELEAKEKTPFISALIKLLENEAAEVSFKSGDNSNLITLTSKDQSINNQLLILENPKWHSDQKDFLHPNLHYYLADIKNPFLAVSIPKNPCPEKKFLAHSLILPPIQIPNILRRARDGTLGAVSPHRGSKLSALIFSPENSTNQENLNWLLEESVALIKNIPKVTWAFLCQSPEQKEFCSKIKEKVPKLNNYQILDIADQEQQIENLSREHFASKNYQLKSLLYTLSSIDAIVSLKSSASINNILELRQEIALGSAAGVSVHCILQNNVLSKELDIKSDLISALGKTQLAESLDYTFFKNSYLSFDDLMASNLSLSNKNSKNFYANFYKKLLKGIKLISIDSLEQWIEVNEEKKIAKRIKALLCASSV